MCTSISGKNYGMQILPNGIEVEGLVTRFVTATDFDVAGQKVTTTASTVYVNGKQNGSMGFG